MKVQQLMRENIDKNGEKYFKGTVILLFATVIFLLVYKDTNKSFDDAIETTKNIYNMLYGNNTNATIER